MLKEIKSDIYHLMHPKMAFFLTSIAKDGKPNVMACAWATPVSEEPPIVVVCVAKEAYTAELIAYADDKYLKKGLWSLRAEIPFHLGGSRIVYFK